MERFLLFHGDNYYPRGGFYNFIGSYNTLEEAQDAAQKQRIEDCWWHIADLKHEEVCLRGSYNSDKSLKFFSLI